jgi:putative SOS response-associated peptidase YedK
MTLCRALPQRTTAPRLIRCPSCGSIAKAAARSIFCAGGLVPWWAKDIKIGARCINAMVETVASKPAFRDAFARGQRCIVPVDAFYEWKKIGAGKQPYSIVAADGLPLALAGLWERWKDRAAGDTVRTFTIITTAPNELCAAIHDRMPVILPREVWATWLGEHEAAPDELLTMLRPYPAGAMRAYPVGVRVGNVRNNDAALLAEISVAA